MRILIIEDEHFAAKRMTSLIQENLPDATILEVIDSVEDSVTWFENNVHPNLVFMDIQLADGLSFQIFDKVKVNCPVIFTTAYDEYALDAFKVNSIDYLLKPIDLQAFKNAVEKFEQFYQHKLDAINWKNISSEIFANKAKFKQRFLIKTGQAYSYLDVSEISLVYSEDGMTFALKANNKKVIIDKTLDQVESTLDPHQFFRINRKYLIPIKRIKKIHPYLNSRLKLELDYTLEDELVVSREKVNGFKAWVDS